MCLNYITTNECIVLNHKTTTNMEVTDDVVPQDANVVKANIAAVPVVLLLFDIITVHQCDLAIVSVVTVSTAAVTGTANAIHVVTAIVTDDIVL